MLPKEVLRHQSRSVPHIFGRLYPYFFKKYVLLFYSIEATIRKGRALKGRFIVVKLTLEKRIVVHCSRHSVRIIFCLRVYFFEIMLYE